MLMYCTPSVVDISAVLGDQEQAREMERGSRRRCEALRIMYESGAIDPEQLRRADLDTKNFIYDAIMQKLVALDEGRPER